jgi:hypothetical protein
VSQYATLSQAATVYARFRAIAYAVIDRAGSPEDDDVALWSIGRVEFCSRIVNARTRDDLPVRAKLTIHFPQPLTVREAEDAVARYAEIARVALENLSENELQERVLTSRLMARPDVKRNLRRLDVTGLHIVTTASPTPGRR